MGSQWKWGYMKTIYIRYSHAKGRKEKSSILDEFCRTYNCHRKHALRLLNVAPPGETKPVKKKRKPFYTNRVISIIEEVWDASGYLWSKRLKPRSCIKRENKDERGRGFFDEKSEAVAVPTNELFSEEKIRHRSSNPASYCKIRVKRQSRKDIRRLSQIHQRPAIKY